MVPPDFRMIGRNLSSGRMKNFNCAKNFAIAMPATATGPSAFLVRLGPSFASRGAVSIGAGLEKKNNNELLFIFIANHEMRGRDYRAHREAEAIPHSYLN